MEHWRQQYNLRGNRSFSWQTNYQKDETYKVPISFSAGFWGLSSSSSDVNNDWYLDSINLIMAIEKEFDIEIPDELFDKITTVQSLLDLVIYCLKSQ